MTKTQLTKDDRVSILNAIEEINGLRRQNEMMAAKLDVFETFRAALLGARPSMGMGIDPAWMLRRILTRDEAADAEAAAGAPATSARASHPDEAESQGGANGGQA